jgi:hypothetical protein
VQYKQVARILIEVIQTPSVPIEVALAAARLFFRLDALPRLGPYKKRSAAQVLWRLASDATDSPEARWWALRKLLALDAAPNRDCKEIQPGGGVEVDDADRNENFRGWNRNHDNGG